MIYISSVDSGSYEVLKEIQVINWRKCLLHIPLVNLQQVSFLNHAPFERCIILRLGMLWPTKYESNFFNVVKKCQEDIKLNLSSEFYVTPYSLVLKYLKNNFLNKKKKKIFGYLTSSNKVTFLKLLNMNNIFPENKENSNYLYKTKNKDLELTNLTSGNWFNWEEEDDFNLTIAKALFSQGKEEILPFWK